MAKTILLFGRSGSGKSSNLSELVEHLYRTSKKKSRVYTADRGGTGPLQPLVDLGVLEIIEQKDTDIWMFLSKACKGCVRDSQGKWVPGNNTNLGMIGFESMTAFGDGLMASLAEKSANGLNVGGGANVSFTVSGDGESLKIGGSNMAHYNVVQTRITEECWASQKLPAEYVVWTASVSRDDDGTSATKVLGPAVVGKALTHEVPRWFENSFRLDCIPAQGGKPERHILYLGNSLDLASGNAVSLGNTRIPLHGKPLPATIEPASLVTALQLIEESTQVAMGALKKRLGL